MYKKYPVRRKSLHTEFSLLRYETRAKIDDGLHDDVAAFLSMRDTGTDKLVSHLLENKFAETRFSDPSYPV